jgi:elongation factor 1-beta
MIEDSMGNVIVVLKIMPDSPESFETIKKAAEKLNPQRLEEEPIAFGLNALKFTTLIPDAGNELEKLENKLKKIPHVNSVETLIVSRSL